MTMDEFLDQVINGIHRRNPGKAVVKTIAASLLANLITLPLGFVSMQLYTPKRRAQLKKELEAKLYGPFRPGLFEGVASKVRKIEAKGAYIQYLDLAPMEWKLRILAVALSDPKKYLEFVQAEPWRSRNAA